MLHMKWDERVHGERACNIQGRLIGPRNPEAGQQREVAHLYVIGSVQAQDERHRNPSNSDLHHVTLQELAAIMEEHDPYMHGCQRTVAAHPDAEDWETRPIMDERKPTAFSIASASLRVYASRAAHHHQGCRIRLRALLCLWPATTPTC